MKRISCTSLVVLLSLMTAPNAESQLVQQGTKLVGSAATGRAAQGHSVSVSADGNSAVVGGYLDNGSLGAAWVYVRSGGYWSQQGGKLVGSNAIDIANQGASVAISADGNTAVVGGPSDNDDQGAAWVFVRSAGVWSEQAKLVSTSAVGFPSLGRSVAISADGSTVIVGGNGDNAYLGAAWVFVRSGSVWNEQAKLVGGGAVGASYQGRSVSLSADGNTALVGGYADNLTAGAAWVFVRAAGAWSQQGSKLVGVDATGHSDQGYSVALSGDGNTAIVGGSADNGNQGAAWVYVRSAGAWSQQGDKLVGFDPVGSELQGASVSMSADGNTASVLGYVSGHTLVATWVFARSGGIWSQLGGELVGSDATGADTQTGSVSMAGDGQTIVVGDNGDDLGAGAAWMFSSTVVAPTPAGSNVGVTFGSSVQLSFSNVTSSGNTQLSLQAQGPAPSGGFQLVPVSPPLYYGITTTSTFTGAVTVCVSYDPTLVVGDVNNLKLMVYDTTVLGWVDITTSLDTATHTICGSTTHFSTFALMEPSQTTAGNDIVPTALKLYPCIPNPVSNRAQIRFELPVASPARLRLFDLQGRLVRELGQWPMLSAGSRVVEWDGLSTNGEQIRAGVYFMRLTSGAFGRMQRVVVLGQ
ncbi:MAG: T9SS type A sorting domain-containing protein [Candidatus Eiseniibacteriota bacterium]